MITNEDLEKMTPEQRKFLTSTLDGIGEEEPSAPKEEEIPLEEDIPPMEEGLGPSDIPEEEEEEHPPRGDKKARAEFFREKKSRQRDLEREISSYKPLAPIRDLLVQRFGSVDVGVQEILRTANQPPPPVQPTKPPDDEYEDIFKRSPVPLDDNAKSVFKTFFRALEERQGKNAERYVGQGLAPVYGYMRSQEEQSLASRFPDKDIGYEALRPRVTALMQQRPLSPSEAYQIVAFPLIEGRMKVTHTAAREKIVDEKRRMTDSSHRGSGRENDENLPELSTAQRSHADEMWPNMPSAKRYARFARAYKATRKSEGGKRDEG